MIALLAQNANDAPASTGPFLDCLREWRMPTQAQYMEYLQAVGLVQAVLLLAVGVVYLVYGWKIFKILVIVNAGVLGALVGNKLGAMMQSAQGANMPVIGAIALSLLFAVLALPLMKYAVSLMGGLAGCFLGYSVWNYACHAAKAAGIEQFWWAGSLTGLITLGLLAFIIFRIVIITFTAFQGALFATTGILGVLLQSDAARETVRRSLESNVYLLPMLVMVPAIIGFAFQFSYFDQKGKAKKPTPSHEKAAA